MVDNVNLLILTIIMAFDGKDSNPTNTVLHSLRHTLDSRQSFEERWTLPQIFVHGYKLIRSFDGNHIRLYFVDPGVKTQISHNFLFLPLSR